MRGLLVLLLTGVVLAQPAPIPPPRQPEEPRGAGVTVEVQIQIQNQPAEGLIVSLARRSPEGRQMLTDIRPIFRVSDAKGMVFWSDIPVGNWIISLRDPKTGFALSLPLQREYLNKPIKIGPYSIQYFMALP